MHKQVKKISAILIVLVFFISGCTVMPAEIVQNTDSQTSIETVVIYRCGPDGGFTPVEISLLLREGMSLEETMTEKCAELAENDEEIQQYLTDPEVNTSLIKSRGRGLHFDFKIRIPVKRYFKKFPNIPPYYKMLKIPVVYARYPRDQRATSIVRSYDAGNETEYTGSHSVLAVGFLGYTTWPGIIAQRGFILRCGFAGYAMVNIY